MTDRKSLSKEEVKLLVREKYDTHDHSPAYDEAPDGGRSSASSSST